jgi:hypothetical protein
VDTLFVLEELPEFPGRREPSRSIAVRGSTAQPHCLRESIVMVARERDQSGVALHAMTLMRTRRTAKQNRADENEHAFGSVTSVERQIQFLTANRVGLHVSPEFPHSTPLPVRPGGTLSSRVSLSVGNATECRSTALRERMSR